MWARMWRSRPAKGQKSTKGNENRRQKQKNVFQGPNLGIIAYICSTMTNLRLKMKRKTNTAYMRLITLLMCSAFCFADAWGQERFVQGHLQIMRLLHLVVPVAVPECLDSSVQQVAQFLAFFFVGSVTGELRHIGYQWVAIRGHWGRWCLGVGTQTGKLTALSAGATHRAHQHWLPRDVHAATRYCCWPPDQCETVGQRRW